MSLSPQAPSPRVATPSVWAPWGLTVAMLVHHFGLWAWTSSSRGIPLLQMLDRWDSNLYSRLVTEGYTWPLWAFLPLYPGTVWLLRQGLGGTLPPQLVGCLLSTPCLLAFVAWNTRWSRQGRLVGALTAGTGWGWFLLLYSPASFTLHSHHTEGLFLLLSFGALAFAARGALLSSAVLVALCVWTRNQGVFVAITAALLLAGREPSWRSRALRFAALGALALLAFGGLLAFEWARAGDPFMFMKAQREWNHVDSVWGAVRGLWLGNPWHKGFNGWLLLRHVFGALWLVAALALLRRDRALGLYALLSLLVMLPQGDLGNAFRFGAVLFPVWFLAGDWLATRPAWVRWTVAVLCVWLNHKVTHAYAIGRWAY
ncbi:mannosyltransferase family protein [Corallococcus sp. CA047B]|uniref:mannosyltransferase family protein n=1 Tax=Corallococcus sp. CA047B TaxID=2316729 RepID=UPI00131507DA|nr:mannosyltransferase family protein [Corallococcus sp. CA047B]